MTFTGLLIANRGEIAIRISRGAAELGLRTVAIYSEDDSESLHVRKADEARPLRGSGVAAYLDAEQIIAVAKEAGCQAIHPGYGFLAENAGFARRCAEEGITFVGPRAETLSLFGDKVKARALAERSGVPVLPGTPAPVTPQQARDFLASLGPGKAIMIKAVAGGGGRGSRAVDRVEDVQSAYKRCQSEAAAAFGNADLYVEQLIPRARHIEVQVIGDGSGAVTHLWERECSIQRRYQKLIEIAPSPGLPGGLRQRLTAAAVRMAEDVHYDNLGTFEFLVDAGAISDDSEFAFIETNPRLQVEHTVTEEVLGLDLVRIQLQLAAGKSLAELGLLQGAVPPPRGFAMQARINMETMEADGSTRPSGGLLTAFEVPSGPGLRTDTFGYPGYRTSPRFDSLLAKVIVHTPSDSFADIAAKTYRALCEVNIEGVRTNVGFLQNLLCHPEFVDGQAYTRFVDDHIGELIAGAEGTHKRLFAEARVAPPAAAAIVAPSGFAGARIASRDPLAVLDYGKGAGPEVVAPPTPAPAPAAAPTATTGPAGTVPVPAPIQGTIVQVSVKPGDAVRTGEQLLVMEAMKMEHVIAATLSGIVRQVTVAQGETIFEGHPLVFIEESEVDASDAGTEVAIDPDYIRPDLKLIHDRHAITLDAARPDAVARRRKTNQRTARENIDDLCDPGSFVEHGSLVLTPGTGLPIEQVIRKFSTDGMVTGVGSVNGKYFPDPANRCVVLSYDYTVLAGTQGALNHPKTDRMLELAEKWRLPVLFFTEGGGGRAGTGGKRAGGQAAGEGGDGFGGRPLDTPTFATMARLSGLVPIVGINSGRCFAGNAALLGCCDVIIATANSNIGMGGPAMIEGGGLGIFTPEEVGPMSIQVPNGTVDIAVEDEAEAVAVAKQYLSYFQGPIAEWEAPDQRLLRSVVPENRLRVYDMRRVIETLADTGSVLELRRQFGPGMITSFIRVEGRPMGVIANNPAHLAGAVDSDGSDKAARFMQLLDAFDIPLLVLCDTPGMMVGPEIEKTALVRHCSRLFVTGANLTIPHMTIVVRKAYGLGAQAMAGGSMKEPFFACAWPTGEFGGMGLEGQVKLGFRNELAGIEDPQQRLQRYEQLVARAYERSKAIHQGVSFGVDDVIDPADSRRWIMSALRSVRTHPRREEKKRRNIDTW
ncbi:MAG: carbamoyl-phosphate synthase large subunit [Chloroflexi bacterium]|nr:carbamoyl-phosphate synthase large subunit [Chloroflexota bacterium]